MCLVRKTKARTFVVYNLNLYYMKISNDTWELLINEHVVNKLSVKAICKKYNMKYTTVYYGLKNHGVAPNKNLTDLRRFEVEDDYFSVIDSAEKAYILGLWVCDGSNQQRPDKSNRIYIKLKEEDKHILVSIKNILAPDYKLTLNSSLKNGETFFSYRLEIASNKLSDDLTKLGVAQDKFLRTLPNVSDEFKGDLIRGVFDADGSISKTKRVGVANSYQVYIAGSNQEFIKQLHTYLGIGKLYLNSRQHLNQLDMLYLRFNSVEEKLKLHSIMYPIKPKLYLHRKLDKYTSYVNTVLSTRDKTLMPV